MLETWPFLATFVGDHRYDDKLNDLSQEAFDRWTGKAEEFLARLRKIRGERVSQRDLVNVELFASELQQRVDLARFRPNLMPVDQLNGPHIDLPLLTSIHPFATVKDYENYVKRLYAFPDQIDEAISCLEEGLRAGIVLARVSAEKVVSQLKLQIVSSSESSDLYEPTKRFPESFSQEERNRLSGMVREAVRTAVVTAYQKLLDFVRDRYLPGCRSEIGLWSLPDGVDYYKFWVRSYTTTGLSPEEIHELGKKELARIHGEMKVIMDKVGFRGDFRSFFKYLREEPRFHSTSAESILQGYREIMERMGSRVDRLFGRVPGTRCEVKEIEAFRAEAAPLAHYFRHRMMRHVRPTSMSTRTSRRPG